MFKQGVQVRRIGSALAYIETPVVGCYLNWVRQPPLGTGKGMWIAAGIPKARGTSHQACTPPIQEAGKWVLSGGAIRPSLPSIRCR
jgi:hypothetical protein